MGTTSLQPAEAALSGSSPADIHAVPPPRHDLACIDVATMRGLEIGPLAAPRVHKNQGSVFYVDHADVEGLRRKYAADPDMRNRLAEILEVDYVVVGNQGIYETVAPDAPFDYVIASHLIEHIPDPVSWFAEVANTLRVGGILSLLIPDKRYCFDVNRRTTDISEIVDAHLRRLRQPSFRQAYDFISKEITGMVDTAAIWAGTTDYADVVRSDVPDPDVAAFELCQTMADSDEFVDVHCHVFTPDSFLELYEKLARIGLIDFEVAYFAPTEVDTLEFFVSLRRLEPALDRADMRRRQLDSVRRVRAQTPADLPSRDSAVAMPLTMEVSGMERRMISAKRRVVDGVRTAIRRSS
jgi:SAM-dependent methyltransferase